MKKNKTISKSKVTKIKSKVKKPSKKRLGMGLSSLLSADTAVDSIIRKKSDDFVSGFNVHLHDHNLKLHPP